MIKTSGDCLKLFTFMTTMSHKTPVIGVSLNVTQDVHCTKLDVALNYIRPLQGCGAVVMLIPPMEFGLLQYVDGLVFIGGSDYDPSSYGRKVEQYTNRMHPLRQMHDLTLMKMALADKRKMPILGICAGCQLINIALGGALIQHIPTDCSEAVDHGSFDGKTHDLYHIVNITENSPLEEIFKTKQLVVNTAHHQALDPHALGVCEVQGETLRVSIAAISSDGLIEAIHVGNRIIGVQWHPERDIAQMPLFEWFVKQTKMAISAS
jgi:putative glutamine amidotransferase